MNRFLLNLALLLLAAPALASTTITGTITNQTVKKPAAGDDVVLIRLAQGMQEATRTRTDARGHYSLNVPDDGVHLVRVTHDKANYFKPAPPGTGTVDVDVFDAAAKVRGVSLDANVIRLQTEPDGKSLRVVENFFLKNESSPPKTQFGERAFEFTLPENAVIEGAAAQGTGGMTVQSPPVPLPEKGHYAFLFPIRPGGQTRFQLSYKLPYSGSLQFSPLATMATDNVVVMMPKSMKFNADGSSFTSIAEEVDAQTYVARGVAQGSTTSFTVSGNGQLPRPTTTPDAGDQSQGGASDGSQPSAGAVPNAAGVPAAGVDTRPGGGLGTPIDTPDPLSKYKWWIIGGLVVALAGGAGILMSRSSPAALPAAASATATTPVTSGLAASSAVVPMNSLLQVLRDELFTLESDRLTGRLTETDYARLKPALETVLQHALQRQTRTEKQL